MADSAVAITAGTGTSIDTRTNAAGEHRQVVTLGNDGDRVVSVMPNGALETFTGLTTLFYDSWTGTLDTTEKWTVTGTAPTLTNGTMTMPTTAGYHAIRTKDVVRPNAGLTLVRNGITLEGTAGTGQSRFYGLGTPATTPSATVLAQDGAGYYIDAAGALFAVVYSGGVQTFSQALPVGGAVPNYRDAAVHAYETQFRVTGATWQIDNFQVPVASKTFPSIAVVELPALIAVFNGATVTGVTFSNIAHLTGDSSRQGASLVDPVIGTRQARVKAPSTAVAATDSPLAVGLHPSSPLPAGTNLVGLFAQRSADLGVSATAAAAAAVTLTLPAPAAGLFHHITSLRLVAYTTAARTGAAAPVTLTTTNLPSSAVFLFQTAAAIGTLERVVEDFAAPMRSAVAATATTFVAPATVGILWRLTATYYVAG